ncbi:hypothetical protein [Paenibacillus rhizoplanae]|uniref:hypothetical protein n=1 Tax=Paenibacillus rhizoplanae TaxID=1917181 RepID=UPI00360D4FC1
MKRYTLYLDEILTGGHFDHFSLMGFAIGENEYEMDIIPYVNSIKNKYFGDERS